MSDERPNARQAGDMSRVSGQYMGHGLTLALATLFFLLVGWWLDSKLGTRPLLLLLGAFVGAGAGFYRLYYYVVIKSRPKSEDAEDAR
ncbi:MAG: hypothetical protein BMS9Abin29_0631 [Gemmatimonadota bacterium]|nr:MAG: hypothetical protein BMS9Abin29_0631 [Gemmatimonadota bacterium]